MVGPQKNWDECQENEEECQVQQAYDDFSPEPPSESVVEDPEIMVQQCLPIMPVQNVAPMVQQAFQLDQNPIIQEKGDLPLKNEYLEMVQNKAMDIEEQLKVKRAPRKKMAPASPAVAQSPSVTNADDTSAFYLGRDSSSSSSRDSANSLGVRVTGWGRWKTVVVPPNMYVVHTRRGHEKPLQMGLGISFKFNPYKDSYLVVPSAMQTILINANTICQELQGILIQAYVQWIIDDIGLAYQKLDFSDLDDPMRVVNLQLREQAEAAIKDKVATMSIKEVLSDKQPIIKELTKRLKEVAEGSKEDSGLGIRIVTVQIKEAIVSSTALWQNLQKPFRASQKTTARLSEIENDSTITQKELEEGQRRAKDEMETKAEIDKLQSQKDAEVFDWEEKEKLRRHQMEQDHQRNSLEADQQTARLREEEEQKLREQKIELATQLKMKEAEKRFEEEKKKMELQLETLKMDEEKLKAKKALDLARIEQEWEIQRKDWEIASKLKREKLQDQLQRKQQIQEFKKEETQMELAFEEQRQKIKNLISSELIQIKATEMLPKIAATLPHPDHLQAITIGGEDGGTTSLVGLVSSLLALLKNQGIQLAGEKKPSSTADEPKK